MILIIYIFAIIAVYLVLPCTSYGWFLSDKKHLSVIEDKLRHDRSLNMFNPNIISSGKYPFISSMLPYSRGLGKYYLNNYGIIPYWSKMHKLVKQAYVDFK